MWNWKDCVITENSVRALGALPLVSCVTCRIAWQWSCPLSKGVHQCCFKITEIWSCVMKYLPPQSDYFMTDWFFWQASMARQEQTVPTSHEVLECSLTCPPVFSDSNGDGHNLGAVALKAVSVVCGCVRNVLLVCFVSLFFIHVWSVSFFQPAVIHPLCVANVFMFGLTHRLFNQSIFHICLVYRHLWLLPFLFHLQWPWP